MATPLKFLLDEINFQRTKELRQSIQEHEAGGFSGFWTDLFVRHFIFETTNIQTQDSDDLLFFVRHKHVKGSSRTTPKYQTDIDVFRRDSRKLPIGDPEISWQETVYLNLIAHHFEYKLTLAICTRTSPKELQVLRRHSQKVYASPSRRKMDTKGDSEEICYPNIFFTVDNFDEIFKDILVRDGEMVCVELVASEKDCSGFILFLGSIRYDALKKVYDGRQSSLSAKVAQRMSFGLLGASNSRYEFVRMKGPQGKGHAEMAVTKPKGSSGVETPTSEPGFCMTDFEAEWDDDGRHRKRRLSDPSANLNNFNRYAFRSTMAPTMGATGSGKAQSENEGLDNLANEVFEVEAGDLHDDRPVLTPAAAALFGPEINYLAEANMGTGSSATASCCNCFAGRRRRSKCLSSASSIDEHEMSNLCDVCEQGPTKATFQEYELADSAIEELEESGESMEKRTAGSDEEDFVKIGCGPSNGRKATGTEEFPESTKVSSSSSHTVSQMARKANKKGKFATFPRYGKTAGLRRKVLGTAHNLLGPPTRTTKDGTIITYWCDLRPRRPKGDRGKS